jgi:flagellar motor switch protein FliN/FliY
MLLNFNHEVVVEIARTQLTGEEITQITPGSIIELDKVAGEPVNLVLGGKTIALGEVVQINQDKLGIRIIGVIQD